MSINEHFNEQLSQEIFFNIESHTHFIVAHAWSEKLKFEINIPVKQYPVLTLYASTCVGVFFILIIMLALMQLYFLHYLQLMVEHSDTPIKSIELQLVRVETCGCAEGYAKDGEFERISFYSKYFRSISKNIL